MSTAKILSYELSPSPATIFGCLLPAPWLGVAAGLMLAFFPLQGLPERFSPLTLAVTHCLALGMLAPVMTGALFQLMPVVAQQAVPAARMIAPFVAVGSALIVAGLSAGFLYGMQSGFMFAAGLAALLYGSVVIALLLAAWHIQVVDATTRTLRWAGLMLGIVVALGIALAGQFAGWWQLDIMFILPRHVAWGLVGWIACLVLGVATTTVPMFWQTRRPSLHWQAGLPGLLWLPLCLAIWPAFWSAALYLGCGIMATLAFISLVAVWHARRRFDPAWPLWLTCAGSWLLAAILCTLNPDVLPTQLATALPWWTGVLALVGGAVLPVNAMLGKIIPFLVFLHLRRQTPAGQRVPTMQAVLPPQRLVWQTRLVLLSLLLLLALPFAPSRLALIAGLAFALAQAWMGILMLVTLWRYRQELRTVLHTSATASPK